MALPFFFKLLGVFEKKMAKQNAKQELKIIKKQEKECVIQGNEISRSFYSCSLMARKIIAFTTTLIKLEKKELDWDNTEKVHTWSAQFSINDFIKKFDITDSGENYKVIRSAIEECQKAKITFEKQNGSFESCCWFYKVKYDAISNLVEMTFSPDVGNAIYKTKLGFTAMKFQVIGKFKSIYTFRYYEIAVSYMGNKGKNGNKKGQWYFEYDIETLRRILGVEEDAYTGRTDNLITWVVKQPVDELNKINTEFQITFEKIKHNRRIVGIHFICTETTNLKIAKTKKIQPKSKTEKLELEKLEVNAENEFFKNHENELNEIFNELSKHTDGMNLVEKSAFSLMTKAKVELTKRYLSEWEAIRTEL